MPDVCIDPGHQRRPDLALEPMSPVCNGMKARCARGTTGIRTKAPEHAITLSVALMARDLLEQRGVTVAMTRTTDDVALSNSVRAELANRSGARLCVKVHCDGVRRGLRGLSALRRGTLTLVPGADCLGHRSILEPSAIAATAVHSAVLREGGLRDRGIETRMDLTGFNWSAIPVLLIELGCLTYHREERKLTSVRFQRRLAGGLATGVWSALGDV